MAESRPLLLVKLLADSFTKEQITSLTAQAVNYVFAVVKDTQKVTPSSQFHARIWFYLLRMYIKVSVLFLSNIKALIVAIIPGGLPHALAVINCI